MAPDKIQPREYSKGGDTDDILRSDGVVSVNGKRNVPELWNDSNDRNLDLNRFDNDWNSNYRFLAVSMSHKLKPPSHGGGLS